MAARNCAYIGTCAYPTRFPNDGYYVTSGLGGAVGLAFMRGNKGFTATVDLQRLAQRL